MTAPALALIPGGKRQPGRPSNAALQLENRGLRAALADITEERDDLADELAAYLAERIGLATDVLALSRRGQVALAAGYRPTQQLVDIETKAQRDLIRARSMGRGDAA